MNKIFHRNTSFSLLLAFGLVTISLNGFAATQGTREVTYYGDNGAYADFFDQDCMGCHTNPVASGAPATATWGVYSSADTQHVLINSRVDAGEMPTWCASPPTSCATNASVLDAWIADGTVDYAPPRIEDGVTGTITRTGVNQYKVAAAFDVNANGGATFYPQRGNAAGSGGFSTQGSTVAVTTGGSGAAGSDDTINVEVTGFSCETAASYRLRGINAGDHGGTTNSDAQLISNSDITCLTGAQLSGTPTAFDEDGTDTWTVGTSGAQGTLAFNLTSITGSPANNPTINSSGTISWTPEEGETSIGVTIRVTDDDDDDPTGYSDTYAVTLNAAPVSDISPVITAIPDAQVGTEDVEFTYDVEFTDNDTHSETHTFSISNLGTDPSTIPISAIDETTGEISWTPTEMEDGVYNVTVTVTDGVTTPDTEFFQITVSEDNDDPIIQQAAPTSETATEDIPYSPTVVEFTATDGDATGGDTDETQTWTLETAPTGMTNTNGAISWTPGEIESGPQSVVLRVTDKTGAFDEVSFSITVTGVNDKPVITTNTLPNAEQDVPYSESVTVTDDDASDVPPTNHTFDISVSPTPVNTTPSINNDGLITWTPDTDDAGITFTFTVSAMDDESLAADDVDIDIFVTDVNYSPTISLPVNDQNATEDTAFVFDITATDPDDPNDDQNWIITSPATPPGNMTIIDHPTDPNVGRLTWTPATESATTVTQAVTVRVRDSLNNATYQDSVSFNIDVAPLDEAPDIDEDAVIAGAVEDEPYTQIIPFTDPDPSDTRTCSITGTTPTNASISISTLQQSPGQCQLSWTPQNLDPDQTVEVTVTDSTTGTALTDTESFVITVAPRNDAPIIDNLPLADQSATEQVAFTYTPSISATDIDGSDTLTWYLVSTTIPDDPLDVYDISVDETTGAITWLPPEGLDRTETVTVRVEDNSLVTPTDLNDVETFNINVTGVNDAPVMVAIPPDTVEEHSEFSYQTVTTDSDADDDVPADMTYDILSVVPTPNVAPAISATGLITWTPGDNDARTVNPAALSQIYTVTVRVADGGEDSAAPDTQAFNMTVTLLDADSDTVPDYEDNCVNTENVFQENHDGDDEGDLCDDDDDNDGINDVAEIENGLNPFDSSDGTADLDGDGINNADEFATCAANEDDLCLAIAIDSVAPVITTNGDISVDSAALLTNVEISATAIDGIDGPVEVSSDKESPFPPGRHIVTWTARDSESNTATVEQTVDVKPQVSLGGSQVILIDQDISVPVSLNGELIEEFAYSYVLKNNKTGNTLETYTGSCSELPCDDIVIFIDTIVGLVIGDELKVELLTVNGQATLGTSLGHIILVSDQAPTLAAALRVEQSGSEGIYVFINDGPITITANVENETGTPVFDWSQNSLVLQGVATTENNQLTIADPSLIPFASNPETFAISANVSDELTLTSVSTELFFYQSESDLGFTDSDGDGIADNVEGWGDSDGDGVPDWQDSSSEPTLLETSGAQGPSSSIAVEQGLSIQLGSIALEQQDFQGNISTLATVNGQPLMEDSGFVFIGSLYDFAVSGLTSAQPIANIVIPLSVSIPANAVYRKFNGSEWFTFVEDDQNALSSTSSDENGCPAPGSELYLPGLLPFRDCLQLSISDGGPNDIDGIVNGIVVDPGGIAVIEDDEILEPEEVIVESEVFTEDGPLSSGALPLWILGLLLVSLSFHRLLILRRKRTN